MPHENNITMLDHIPEDRFIKKVALFTFKGVRSLFSQAQKAPVYAIQASADIRAAWVESSHISPTL